MLKLHDRTHGTDEGTERGDENPPQRKHHRPEPTQGLRYQLENKLGVVHVVSVERGLKVNVNLTDP